MSSYIRTTRECSVSQLQSNLSQALRDYFQKHSLGDLDNDIRICCETIAEKQNPGSLTALLEGNPDTTIHLATILTADWLVWVRSGDKSGTAVSGARLRVIKVKAFISRRTKNMQLEISGFINNSKEYVRGNLEMGPDLAAQKFCDEVGQAISKVTPPPKRKWFGLMSG
jgi:hypothetical protein